MQTQAINNINFGKIYLVKGNYNDAQHEVIRQVKSILRRPFKKYGNISAEKFYESREKMDFFLNYNYRNENALDLFGVVGAKCIEVGKNKVYKFSEKFKIGTYDKEHTFKEQDIELGIKNKQKNHTLFSVILGVIGLFMFALGVGMAGGQSQKSENADVPLIENADSLANKVKSVIPDTTKTLNLKNL